jgi:hypothetical protein
LVERRAAALPFELRRWAPLAIVLLAFALRAYSLGWAPLRFDEVLSGDIAAKGWRGIVLQSSTTPFEHPPLYYMALHLWTVFTGGSAFALRFFSLFWGVLLIPLLFRFVRTWGGHRLALLAALIAALSVSHIEQSQNARMYTAVVFLGVLSLHLFLQALQNGRRIEWLGYLIVTALGTAIHYYFVLLLLLPVAFFAQRWRQYRRLLAIFGAILIGTGLLAASWLWFSPGPRQALEQILRGEGGGVSSLALRARYTIGGLLLEEPIAGSLALGILAVIGILSWPIPPHPLTRFRGTVGSRRFLLTWLLVPWLAALAIPYYLQGRHLAYLWPALFTLAAAGLVALLVRRRWLFLAGLLLVLTTSAYGLYGSNKEAEDQPDYGEVIAHIEDRSEPGDLIVMDQPAMWPFVDYYAQKDLDLAYVAPSPTLGEEAIAEQLASLAAEHSRIWLGPVSAWTADPEGLVAKWLDTNACQAYREWFQGSTSAALYFTPTALNRLPLSRAKWENGIRLLRVFGSPMDVVPGDAVCLEFHWETSLPMEVAAAVSLDLVDQQGNVWASRSSAPCSGSCPTNGWQPGQTYRDRHALLIPPGTPPGTYQLQLSWYVPAEERTIQVKKNGARIDLGAVTVTRGVRQASHTATEELLSDSMHAKFGDQLALLGFNLAQPAVPAGRSFLLDLKWSVLEVPSDDLVLRLELVDAEDQVVATWDRPPIAGFFPASSWQQGDYMRGLKQLDVPGQVLPGSYWLRLKVLDQTGQPLPLGGSRQQTALGGLVHWTVLLEGNRLDLGPVQVLEKPDRARTFDLPTVSHSLNAQVGDQAELVGYDLEAAASTPGGELDLTLYWRALGPMDRSYKVFAHLGDGLHPPLAQDDAVPGQGCCPTNTWVEGEIIVDRHVILLPDDLPSGTYQLMTGLYDESSGERLPVSDGVSQEPDDQILISEVAIQGVPTAVPAPASTSMPFGVYLPLVTNDW